MDETRRSRLKSSNPANPEEFPSPFSQKGPIVLNVPAQITKPRPNPEPRVI